MWARVGGLKVPGRTPRREISGETFFTKFSAMICCSTLSATPARQAALHIKMRFEAWHWLPSMWCAVGVLAAGSFEFRDFASRANLNVVGDARLTGKHLRLTDARMNIAGAAWYSAKEPVSHGFDTTFQFQLTAQGGLGNGADGFAFVVQNGDPSV